MLGSVKHLIGHTKAAAGVAGLIKAVLSSKYGILPPSKRTSGLHHLLENNSNYLKLLDKPVLCDDNQLFRAGISSFGFGGINVHITIEESANNIRAKKVSSAVKKFSTTPFDFEIFPITSNSFDSLLQKLEQIKTLSRDISRAEMIDLSNSLIKNSSLNGKFKTSIVAKNPESLNKKVSYLIQNINQETDLFFDIQEGVYYSSRSNKIKNAFLFPGQGAPIYSKIGAFENINFDTELVKTTSIDVKNEIIDTSIAQPHIIERTLDSLSLLENFGVESEYGIGHSLGEIAALSWSGCINKKEAIDLAALRGKMMSQYGEKDGAMLAIKCSYDEIKDLMIGTNAVITGFNGTGSFVVGGYSKDIFTIENKSFVLGFQTTRLNVSNAFHTPLMKKAALKFRDETIKLKFNSPNKKVFSTLTSVCIDEKTNLNQHLFEQIEKPVKFIQAIENVKTDVTFMFEIGPGNALSKSLIGEKDVNVIALNYGSNSLEGFLNILSASFISGNQIEFEELSANRFFRDFDLYNWKLDVLENPCEKVLHEGTFVTSDNSIEKTELETKQVNNDFSTSNTILGITAYLKKIISEKTDIPIEIITDNDKIMSQLHINSLAITEILSLTTKIYNKTHKVFSSASILANSDASIIELGKLIYEGEVSLSNSNENKGLNLDSLPNWSHTLLRKDVPKKLVKLNSAKEHGRVFVDGKKEVCDELLAILNNEDITIGNGSIFVYSSDYGTDYLESFLNFLKNTDVRKGEFVVLVDLTFKSIVGDLKPILRSFQQEVPDIKTLCISIDSTIKNYQSLLIDEIKNINKYKEVKFDSSSRRTESEVEVIFPIKNTKNYTINKDDVILASGGGKGITFESVFELAKETGASLAIFGRSKPVEDELLSKNLDLLERNNIKFKYYSVDVLNKEELKTCVNDITTSLGDIRTIIHGAGVNNPNRIEYLTVKDFDKTFSVKVEGIKNIIEIVDTSKISLMIGFGSIIAESGMQGNADYAWANDQLALEIESFSKDNPNCKCVTFEWSVWDETGMGVNLNSIEVLKGQGVWPIPIKNGIEVLKSVITDEKCSNGRFIVTGRFGKIPTLVYSRRKPIIGRFIANITNHVPNIEIVSEVNISLNDDIYLKNHVFDGQYVFPTVMILEGMAQVCQYINPINSLWTFENLKINKSIFIPKEGNNIIRFIAVRISEQIIKVIVQSEDSNFEVACFEAEINLHNEVIKTIDIEVNDYKELQFDVSKKFYDDLLFHEGPFRRIISFSEINSLGSLSKAISNDEDEWFSSFLSEEKLLGDPGLNDAAIHCHQASRPHQRLLPTSSKSIIINPEKIEGPFFIKTVELREEANTTTIDVFVFNGKGQIKEIWNGLTLTQVSGTSFKGEWDYHFLVPFIEYKIRHTTKKQNIKLLNVDCKRLCDELLINGSLASSIECENMKIQLATLTNASSDVKEGFQEVDSENIRLTSSNQEFSLTIFQEKLKPIKN